MEFSPSKGYYLFFSYALCLEGHLWMVFIDFWMGISAIRVLYLGFLDQVSEFSAIYFYDINVSW
jgi:hypothetical protein